LYEFLFEFNEELCFASWFDVVRSSFSSECYIRDSFASLFKFLCAIFSCVGIDHRLLLGSTIGSWWDRPSALGGIDRRLLLGSTIGSWWDRPSALGGIDRRLLLGSTIGSWWDKSCAQTQQRTHAAFCISLAHFYNDEYRVFL
jgi:hypothetical protein